MGNEFNGFEMENDDIQDLRTYQGIILINQVRVNGLGVEWGEEEGTKSRNIWELLFLELGYVGRGKRKDLEDFIFTWTAGCMVLSFPESWDTGDVVINFLCQLD